MTRPFQARRRIPRKRIAVRGRVDKESVSHEFLQHRFARRRIHLPQAARLAEREIEPRHLLVFATDARQQDH